MMERKMERKMVHARQAPSLVDMCIKLAIDNIRYIGDVGETDSGLLEKILPHCSVDQLAHIERSTEGRDLSSVTDRLWRKFYEKHFGTDNTKHVIERMNKKNVVFKWRLLYQAKTKEREEAQKKSVDRLRQLYAKEENRKQSRQIKICSKIPPTGSKRNYSGGYDLSNVKSNIMKKAKIEYLKSPELKIHAAIRRNALQRNSYRSQSVSQPSTSSSRVNGSSFASKAANSLARR